MRAAPHPHPPHRARTRVVTAWVRGVLAILPAGCGPTYECLLERGDTYVDCGYAITQANGYGGDRAAVERSRTCVLESIAARRSFRTNGYDRGVDTPGSSTELLGVRRDGSLLVYTNVGRWSNPCLHLALFTVLHDTHSQLSFVCSLPGHVTTAVNPYGNGYVDAVPLDPVPAAYANQPPSCAAMPRE